MITEYTHFTKLNSIDVSNKIEKKTNNGVELSYLSWSHAWSELKKHYPTANYEIQKFNDLPYVYDERTGYIVYTKMTVEGLTHEMWLPVTDGANKAMKANKYEYEVKGGFKKQVAAATMFDINTAIMRCLVKNIAMFGLGLYIYAGEDLPSISNDNDDSVQKKRKADLSIEQITINPLYKKWDNILNTLTSISEIEEFYKKNNVGLDKDDKLFLIKQCGLRKKLL